MQKHFATAIFEAIEDRINEVLLLPLGQTFILATCTDPPYDQGWWRSACKNHW